MVIDIVRKIQFLPYQMYVSQVKHRSNKLKKVYCILWNLSSQHNSFYLYSGINTRGEEAKARPRCPVR